jgi:hypothetical protein
MPADLILPSETRHFNRPRRPADLDLWLKIFVPLFLLASRLIAVDPGFFSGLHLRGHLFLLCLSLSSLDSALCLFYPAGRPLVDAVAEAKDFF